VQLFRTILMTTPSEAKQANNNSENRQISKEIKDLKKELKSIQTMLTQLKTGNLNAAPSAITDSQESSRIIKLCK
jgi:septal ring factor EnvC (AmiA/AmiB activator)